MIVKLIEIRDRGTCIPAMAVQLRNRTPREFGLLRHAGYSAAQIGGREEDSEPYIVLCKLDGVEAHYDPYDWPNQRTMGTAHRHLIAHWAEVMSGDVVDVQFVLGERAAPTHSDVTE